MKCGAQKPMWQEIAVTPAITDVGSSPFHPKFATLYIEKTDARETAGVTTRQAKRIEVTRLTCSKSRSFSGKHVFELPDYVIRRGSMILYADEENYEEALAIARGDKAVDGYSQQPFRWFSHNGEDLMEVTLQFKNLTRKKNVPPAKWFLYVPKDFRFDKRRFPAQATTLGYLQLCARQFKQRGPEFPLYGKLEFYGGSYVVTDTTFLPETVSKWLTDTGWRIIDNCAIRFYKSRFDRIYLTKDYLPVKNQGSEIVCLTISLSPQIA